MDLYVAYLEFMREKWLTIFAAFAVLAVLRILSIAMSEEKGLSEKRWVCGPPKVPGWYWWWNDHRTDDWETQMVRAVETDAFGKKEMKLIVPGQKGSSPVYPTDWFHGPHAPPRISESESPNGH